MSEYVNETLDLAALPLADGRQVLLPLLTLAEVQQVKFEAGDAADLGTLKWRGHDIEVVSLEAFCGLDAAPREQHTTVGIFRANKDSKQPFQALAFCGLAAHMNVNAEQVETEALPEGGNFASAATINGETYLIPSLEALGYKEGTVH
ncbi:hypothetical protein A3709_04085 [Halioglobus sp. HI00S01]|uniref:chemotaxis protein CheW n=1 Tax=Halioglobus sp. HI00S01 TaxID=1822214 RepID=UPI0007C322A7|nr:chemotaxis protein CheW [Halioglobus sp. HI00S01]KZX56960.1 hypothetical protein A3709_04085 [Halioglobus sp. HI00S01]